MGCIPHSILRIQVKTEVRKNQKLKKTHRSVEVEWPVLKSKKRQRLEKLYFQKKKKNCPIDQRRIGRENRKTILLILRQSSKFTLRRSTGPPKSTKKNQTTFKNIKKKS